MGMVGDCMNSKLMICVHGYLGYHEPVKLISGERRYEARETNQ